MKILNERKILRRIDMIFYVVVLPLILLLLPIDKMAVHDSYFFSLLIVYMVGVYYVNRRFNIPALYFRRRYVKASVVVAAVMVVTYLMTRLPIPDTQQPQDAITPEVREKIRALTVWFLFIINMSFGLLMSMMIELFRQIIYRQSLEAEKNKAEIALYKAQINPHFLFNTLNTLYGLLLTQSEKTEEVFIKFSDILKYMYTNADREMIPISEEIDYIREYIELQSLRLGKHTTVDFRYTVDDDTVEMPPMMLITFIENAFKYGVSSRQDSTVEIEVTLKEKHLTFTTQNTIFPHAKKTKEGIGIENCRKRLELLYPNHYSLSLTSQDNIFKSLLTIDL